MQISFAFIQCRDADTLDLVVTEAVRICIRSITCKKTNKTETHFEALGQRLKLVLLDLACGFYVPVTTKINTEALSIYLDKSLQKTTNKKITQTQRPSKDFVRLGTRRASY